MENKSKRGKGDLKITWKKNGIRRDATISGDFSESEIVTLFASLIKSELPDSFWLEGYAAGRNEAENHNRLLEAFGKKNGGKK